ncbi:MAG: sulfotransferase domain-containing protein [Anaerolineales bacterium]|nr:sulfotransferase domain-containing protein [Anaerolineales bacterium]
MVKLAQNKSPLIILPRVARKSLELQARLVRRTIRRFAQKTRFKRFDLKGMPVLFANSFPKSGTHLLTQALQGFTQLGPAIDSGLPAVVMYEGDSGRTRAVHEILEDLHRLLPGDIAYGHLHAIPEVVEFLRQDGFATYFILRDPRDVVISHVHYVTDLAPRHALHRYYLDNLPDFDERLKISILGLPGIDFDFPNIRQRFEPFLGWMDCPDVMILHFEDFVADRKSVLGKVVDFAVKKGFPLNVDSEETVRILENNINPQRSPTFRSGKTGGWRSQFNPEHKRLFKDISGDLLITLGYEKDNDW